MPIFITRSLYGSTFVEGERGVCYHSTYLKKASGTTEGLFESILKRGGASVGIGGKTTDDERKDQAEFRLSHSAGTE